MATTLIEVVKTARQRLGELTGLPIGSTVSVRMGECGWCVQVEVVEKESIPDSQDILATYELQVDQDGEILDMSRVGMRKRSDVMVSSGVE